jgi:hypothetical protein
VERDTEEDLIGVGGFAASNDDKDADKAVECFAREAMYGYVC